MKAEAVDSLDPADPVEVGDVEDDKDVVLLGIAQRCQKARWGCMTPVPCNTCTGSTTTQTTW